MFQNTSEERNILVSRVLASSLTSWIKLFIWKIVDPFWLKKMIKPVLKESNFKTRKEIMQILNCSLTLAQVPLWKCQVWGVSDWWKCVVATEGRFWGRNCWHPNVNCALGDNTFTQVHQLEQIKPLGGNADHGNGEKSAWKGPVPSALQLCCSNAAFRINNWRLKEWVVVFHPLCRHREHYLTCLWVLLSFPGSLQQEIWNS